MVSLDSRKLAAAVAKAQNHNLTEDQQEAITGAAMRQHKKHLQENKDRLLRLMNLAFDESSCKKSWSGRDLRKKYTEGENEEEWKEQEKLFKSFCSNCPKAPSAILPRLLNQQPYTSLWNNTGTCRR